MLVTKWWWRATEDSPWQEKAVQTPRKQVSGSDESLSAWKTRHAEEVASFQTDFPPGVGPGG